MKIEINNREPFIPIDIKGKMKKRIPIKCVVDTGFTGSLSIPYFEGKSEYLSLINNIKFFTDPVELPKNKWIETAAEKTKTFKTFIGLYFGDTVIKSELIIYKSSLKYSKNRDVILLGMEFLEENEKKLNLDFKKKVFELN